MEVDLQSLIGLHITWCAQLYSLAETPKSPPTTAFGLVLRGRYWSEKIDDISLLPPWVYCNPCPLRGPGVREGRWSCLVLCSVYLALLSPYWPALPSYLAPHAPDWPVLLSRQGVRTGPLLLLVTYSLHALLARRRASLLLLGKYKKDCLMS